MSAMTTRQPLASRSLVRANPMPEAAPVMTAPRSDIAALEIGKMNMAQTIRET